MLSYVDLLLRAIGAIVALPTGNSAAILVLAGVAGLAVGGAVALLAVALLTSICSFLGVDHRVRVTPGRDAPRLSRQSDPDAAGQPKPRAPGRLVRPTATTPL